MRPFVEHRFSLSKAAEDQIRSTPYKFGYGAFGEAVFYRTYSLWDTINKRQENFHDVVLRVINGVFSIRKDHYLKHRLPWDEEYWQDLATEMGLYFVKMLWTPPGRGWSKMGTEYVYERGSMCLNNCAASTVNHLSKDCGWIMDALMLGCGVGFEASPDTVYMLEPSGPPRTVVVPDSREGWVESVELLIRSYEEGSRPIKFDYSEVRPKGEPIKGFGGTSSGPAPLMKLHDNIRETISRYHHHEISSLRLRADIVNMIGICVVSGNVRRSAEIAIGNAGNTEFLDLKNYSRTSGIHARKQNLENDFADSQGKEADIVTCDDPKCRCQIGWMSNNSVRLTQSHDFLSLPAIAHRVRTSGDPGILNMVNVKKYGKYGKEMYDPATLFNPCGEIPLEDKELCNLAEIVPVRCNDYRSFLRACEFAATYTQTVSLLPTHRPETNRILAKNRRNGNSLTGIADWMALFNFTDVTRWMKDGYQHIRKIGIQLADQSGVQPPIRSTTVKPSGTISKVIGVRPGIHSSLSQYVIRRMRIATDSPALKLIKESGYHVEPEIYDPETTQVVSFPVNYGGGVPNAHELSIWEQGMIAAMVQREWADNSVSVTITFDNETEGKYLERFLAQFTPVMKSMSILPRNEKCYAQQPEEEITESEYQSIVNNVNPIEWENLKESYGYEAADKYCASESCELTNQ